MGNENPNRLGVIGVTSMHAGGMIGLSTAIGKSIVGAGLGSLTFVGRALRKTAGLLHFDSRNERIRSIIVEELSRLLGRKEEPLGAGLEERLQLMAQTLLALQERVNELSARGPVDSAGLWKAIGSLEAAAPLSHDERAVLVSVFKQNVALQKPELAHAPAGEHEPE